MSEYRVRYKSDYPLIEACRTNNFELVKLYINDKNINVTSVDKYNYSALFYSVYNNNVEILSELLNHEDIDINCVNMDGDTPLHCSIENNNEKLVKFLLQDNRIDVNKKNKYNDEPILTGLYCNNNEIIELLLNHPSINLIDMKKNLLHYAIIFNNDKIFNSLLKRLDINYKDDEGNSLLHLAAKYDNIKILKLLLNHGMDVNEVNCNDETPLFVAIKNDSCEVFDNLVDISDIYKKNKENVSSLCYSIFNGNLNFFKKILNKVEQFEKRNNVTLGITLLHFAILQEKIDIVKLLLNKYNINTETNHGYTFLHYAIFKKNIEIVKLLLDKDDIDVNKCYNNGLSPLNCAIMVNSYEIVKLLLQHKNINVNQKDDENYPINLGIKKRNNKIIKELTKHPSILINTNNGYGKNTLYLAFKYKNDHIINKIMDDPNYDINEKINDYTCLIYFVAKIKNLEDKYIDKIINHPNININIEISCFWSPLNNAFDENNLKLFKKLLRHPDINPDKIKYKKTLLEHIITSYNSHKIAYINLLINDSRVNLKRKNYNGNTYLHICVEYYCYNNGATDKSEILKLLLDKKIIDVNSVNNDGLTPLELSVSCYNTDIKSINILLREKHNSTYNSLISKAKDNIVKQILQSHFFSVAKVA